MARVKATGERKTSTKKASRKTGAPTDERSESVEPGAPVSPEERWRLIAEAAYYRAQARGFQGGNAADDWAAAEAEIDRKLAGAPESHEQAGDETAPEEAAADEAAAYARLRKEVQKSLAAMKGSLDAKAVQRTVEAAAERIKRARLHAGGNLNKAAERLKKEFTQAAAGVGPRWQAVSGKSAGMFAVWRDRSAVFLARTATSIGQWLNQAGRRLERPQYRAGAMVSSGSFQCARCGSLLHMEASGPLPHCPTCQHSEFRRVP